MYIRFISKLLNKTKCNIHIEYGQKSASPNRITEPSAVVQADHTHAQTEYTNDSKMEDTAAYQMLLPLRKQMQINVSIMLLSHR